MAQKKKRRKFVYVGWFTYAGYEKVIVADSEELAWKEMKKEYYQWRKAYGSSPYFHTFKEAIEWFGYRVNKEEMNTMFEW